MNLFIYISIVLVLLRNNQSNCVKVCKHDLLLQIFNENLIKKAQDCEIVDGSVAVVDISVEKCKSLRFPLLREIRHYLLMGFCNCSNIQMNMFPNLFIIHGEVLLQGYSLIVHSNAWSAVNFPKLRHIPNGAIFVTQNKNLCFTEKINWFYLNNNNFQKSEETNLNGKVTVNTNKYICNDNCPINCVSNNCWSSDVCQSMCHQNCTSQQLVCHIDQPNQCCHIECRYGCHGTRPDQCSYCKHVTQGTTCLKQCNQGFIETINRTCITELQCSQSGNYIVSSLNKCIDQCPINKRDIRANLNYCVDYRSQYNTKECDIILIIKIKDLKSVENCWKAKRIVCAFQDQYSDDVMSQFRKAFKNLRVVTDFIQFIKSSNLNSLDFLNSLERIEGKYTIFGSDNIVLDITGNKDLESLWQPNPRFTIGRNGTAKIQILANQLLCLDKIHKLINEVTKPTIINNSVVSMVTIDKSEMEIINVTNGQMAICNKLQINISEYSLKSSGMELMLSLPQTPFSYRIMNSLIYYEQVNHSISQTDQPACDRLKSKKWRTGSISCRSIISTNNAHPILYPSSNWPNQKQQYYNKDNVTKNISFVYNQSQAICKLNIDLEPAQTYRFYVEFRFTKFDSSAVSNILLVTTPEQKPSPPYALTSHPLSDSSIELAWQSPLYPNGQIDFYIVAYKLLRLDLTEQVKHFESSFCEYSVSSELAFLLHTRQYNYHPFMTPSSNSSGKLMNSSLLNGNCDNCYFCQEKCRKLHKQRQYTVTLDQLYYQQMIQELEADDMEINDEDHESSNESIMDNFTLVTMHPRQDDHQHRFVVQQLQYFAEYTFEVYACHRFYSPFSNITDLIRVLKSSSCSYSNTINGMTQSNHLADIVRLATNQSYNSANRKLIEIISSNRNGVNITWQQPSNPNGCIIMYNIRYRKIDDRQKWSYACMSPDLHQVTIPYDSQMASTNSLTVNTVLPIFDSGVYWMQIMPVSLAGNGSWSEMTKLNVQIDQDRTNRMIKIIIGLSLMFSIIVIVVLTSILVVWRRKLKEARKKINNIWTNEIDEWAIEPSHIQIRDPIGKGSFGLVYSGVIKQITSPYREFMDKDQLEQMPMKVAIKTLSQPATLEQISEFLAEGAIMKQMMGQYLVRLIGIYGGAINNLFQAVPSPSTALKSSEDTAEGPLQQTSTQPAPIHHLSSGVNMPMVVMELMELGDLSSYLHSYVVEQHIADKGFIQSFRSILWSIQLADGMAYLSNKHLVHRDLAARNCLLDKDLTLKIADFGLARTINENYYYRKKGQARMPVRWMAPESLKSAIFTTKSDVWSYGIVLYEIATLASLPYFGMDHEQVIAHVTNGGRPEIDEMKFPSCLLDAMEWCWCCEESDRPDFMNILEYLVPYLLSNNRTKHSNSNNSHDNNPNTPHNNSITTTTTTDESQYEQQQIQLFHDKSFYFNGYHGNNSSPSGTDPYSSYQQQSDGCHNNHHTKESCDIANDGKSTLATSSSSPVATIVIDAGLPATNSYVAMDNRMLLPMATHQHQQMLTLSIDDILNLQSNSQNV